MELICIIIVTIDHTTIIVTHIAALMDMIVVVTHAAAMDTATAGRHFTSKLTSIININMGSYFSSPILISLIP